uniref:Receptor-like serine/threonine-protein kinase n=1 Tax=Fagus sylvatica TaxID=28930 RepID=A0A2N9F9M6_FAGSY
MDNKKNPWPMLYVFFICLSLNNHLSLGADTISANQSLSGDQTIVSKGGNFELGFFKPGNSSLSKYYVGMWYKKVSLKTIVWVANRDKPVSDKSSSVLRISEDGNLVLLNETQLPVWSTNLSFTSSGPVQAVLQDDGNLGLKDGSNSSKPFWQSFDNPAHTWLPGAKIAYNNKTKQSQRLISWKNSENPAPGLFSLELDVNSSSYISLWNNSKQYWTSGSWNVQFFGWVAEMRYNYFCNFSYQTNENESYFTYSLYDPSIISRFVMGVSGQIQQLTWLEPTKQWNLFWAQPRSQCEVYAYCGAYGICNQQSLPFCNCLKGFQPTLDNSWNLSDYSGGCKRKTSLQCGNASLANGKRDKFLEMPNMEVPLQAQSVVVGSSSECESTCLNNCSCTAYAYDKGCSIWIGDLLNLRQLTSNDSSGGTLYLKLAASELPSSRITEPSKKGAIKRKEEKHLLELTTPDRLLDADELRNTGHNINVFSFASIATATNNFSPESKLGEGGFGPVYKGRLPEGREFAVKRLSRNSGQGLVEFKNELILITKLQHMNLVRLLGCCFQGEEKMLIYEYMPNKSLDSFLFG